MKEIIGRKVKRSDKIIKVTPDILKQISPEKKEVWVFLGAGTIDNYINEL